MASLRTKYHCLPLHAQTRGLQAGLVVVLALFVSESQRQAEVLGPEAAVDVHFTQVHGCVSSLSDTEASPCLQTWTSAGCVALIMMVTLVWRWCQVAEVHYCFLKHWRQLKYLLWGAQVSSSWYFSLKWSQILLQCCVSLLPDIDCKCLVNNTSSVLLFFLHHCQFEFFHCWMVGIVSWPLPV